MKSAKHQAQIITVAEVKTLSKKLPASWTNAIGILKGKKINALGYQRKIRQEWDQRLKRQIRLAHHGA